MFGTQGERMSLSPVLLVKPRKKKKKISPTDNLN